MSPYHQGCRVYMKFMMYMNCTRKKNLYMKFMYVHDLYMIFLSASFFHNIYVKFTQFHVPVHDFFNVLKYPSKLIILYQIKCYLNDIIYRVLCNCFHFCRPNNISIIFW